MFDYRSAPDDAAAARLDTPSADTGSQNAARRRESNPVPRVDPVQFRLPGSYSMDGMTAVLPDGVFQVPESSPQCAVSPPAAGQPPVPKKDKRGGEAR